MIKFQKNGDGFFMVSFLDRTGFVQKIEKINWKKWYIQKIFKHKIIYISEIFHKKIKNTLTKLKNNLNIIKLNKEDLE